MHLQLGLGQIAFGHFDFSFVFSSSRVFFGFFLQDIVGQFVVLRLLVEKVAQLGLAVKFHQQLALFHARSSGLQVGNGEGAFFFAGKGWGLNRTHTRRLRCAGQAQRAIGID